MDFSPVGGFWLPWMYGVAREELTLRTEAGYPSLRHSSRIELGVKMKSKPEHIALKEDPFIKNLLCKRLC